MSNITYCWTFWRGTWAGSFIWFWPPRLPLVPTVLNKQWEDLKETNFQKYIFLFLSSLLIPNHLDDISRCIIYDSNATYVTEFPETLMIGKILHQILTSLIFTSSCLFSAASFIGVFPYLSVVILAPCLSNHRTWDSKLLHYYMPVL